MYTLKGSVGKGQANHRADVAFVQFALKVISFKGKTYGSEPITGKYTEKLGENIIDLPGTGSIKGIHQHNRITGTGVVTSLSGLLSLIPAKYKSFQFKFEKVGSVSFAYLIKSSQQQYVAKYKPKALALPNAEAKALVAIFQTIVRVYNVKPEIKKITVDHNGYFGVQLKLSGGHFLDPKTAEIVAVDKQHVKERIITFMGPMVKAGKLHAKTLWEFIGREKIILKSSNQYSLLKLNEGTKTWLRWQLGNHKTSINKHVVERALDVYEFHRLGGALKPEELKFMIELFGSDWTQIKEKQEVKEAYAKDRKDELVSLLTLRDVLKDRLWEINDEFKAHTGFPLMRELGSLAIDALLIAVPAAASKVVKNVAKESRIDKNLTKLGTTATFDLPAAKLSADLAKTENDKLFAQVMLGITVVGLVLLTVATFGAALGAAAAVTTTAAATGSALGIFATGVSLGKVMSDGLGVYKEYYKDNQKVTALLASYDETSKALDETVASILPILAAINAEVYVTLPDFGFASEEIAAAKKEITDLGL